MEVELKVKDHSSINIENGDMIQVELDGLEESKAVILKIGGKLHATSANCTHYGAPLVKGILSSEGRIVCPWHGACFRVDTGDVEDAPALDPLAKFEVVERDGEVFLKGAPASFKANRGSASHRTETAGDGKIVLVGGGSAAVGCIQALRENGSKIPITIISNEGTLPIDRTKLSKALIGDANKLLLRNQEWFDMAGVSVVHETVSSIDFEQRVVYTESGKQFSYSKLVLASGGIPRRLPLPGFRELGNIFVLRRVSDVQDILTAIGERGGRKIVVVGSSFIGLEVSNALSKENSVTVVGMETTPLQRVLGQEVGLIIQKNLEKNGISFYMNAAVDKATPSIADKNLVGAVHLKDGSRLDADLVILGVGVSPATEYLKNSAGVSLEKDGSLRTGEDFQVPGMEGVFAVGDIATFPYRGPGGNSHPVRIEHWNVAQNAGRSVGLKIANPQVQPKPFIPVFWSALGSQLRYCGNTATGTDGLVLKGEREEGRFTAYYTKEDEVVAVASMGMDPIMAKSVVLMSAGKMPKKADIEDNVDVLSIE